MKPKLSVKQVALIGVLGGISSILMYIQFPIPFMPPFMSYDPSSIVEMIGGFALGPVPAVLIILVKLLVKLVLQGTSSAFTGEIQNFLISCAYVLPAVLIYDRRKNRKSAVAGMGTGTIICAVVAIFTNIYMIIPFYVTLMGLTMEKIITMCSAVNPYMTDVVTMALLGIVPFNLIKFGVNSLITILIYKKISVPMKKILN